MTQAGGNMVLVSMETTAGESPLRHTRDEIEAVRGRGHLIHVNPITPEKKKNAVRSALEACEIFHFAGHGFTDTQHPLRSLLLLDDWRDDPMTVGSLLDTNLQDRPPFLAYLSACGTGESPDDRSVDESIHLTSAFQLAGFRHVIGTLWDVNDALSVDMAQLVYEILGERGLTDEAVSYGLHSATRQLRDKWIQNMTNSSAAFKIGRNTDEQAIGPISRRIIPKDTTPYKLLWTPYIHYGV
jgi:CHAT domain-containing protein